MTGASEPSLSEEVVDALVAKAEELGTSDNDEAAWDAVTPLLDAAPANRRAAEALLHLIGRDCLAPEHALAALEKIEAGYRDDIEMTSSIGENLDKAIDLGFLNAAPSEASIFPRTITALERAWRLRAFKDEISLLEGLAICSRLHGRQKDDLAERALKRLIELDPKTAFRHYNYGLFLKTRGRFEEGMRANQRAAELSQEPSEETQWNLGICATGAGHGDVALKVWKELGIEVEMGRFGLPEGAFSSCKVRLAERPLAERTKENDDPGAEETIWIQRLSACHGIVRSVLYNDLGVDYGDVVLFDGAPITYHKHGDRTVPVFPHMATLIRGNFQFFDFAATQEEPHSVETVNDSFDSELFVYLHTDNFVRLCANCWADQNRDHAEHREVSKNVVKGRIAAAPDISPPELLARLDAAMQPLAPCRIFAPDLCDAAGQHDRARIEQRRFDMLWNRGD